MALTTTGDAEEVQSRLLELKNLKAGWLNGEGELIDPLLVDWLLTWIPESVEGGLAPPYVYPTVEGGVQLEWGNGHLSISAEFIGDRHLAVCAGVNVFSDRESEATYDVSTPTGKRLMTQFVHRFLRADASGL